MPRRDFWEYELANNEVVKAIVELATGFPQSHIVQSILAHDAAILAPQSVSLPGSVSISRDLLETHVAFFSDEGESRIVTLNGLSGTIQADRISMTLNRQVGSEHINPLTDPNSLLSLVDSHSAPLAKPQQLYILREGSVTIADRAAPLLLLSAPIDLPGCDWSEASSASPTRVRSKSATTAESNTTLTGGILTPTKLHSQPKNTTTSNHRPSTPPPKPTQALEQPTRTLTPDPKTQPDDAHRLDRKASLAQLLAIPPTTPTSSRRALFTGVPTPTPSTDSLVTHHSDPEQVVDPNTIAVSRETAASEGGATAHPLATESSGSEHSKSENGSGSEHSVVGDAGEAKIGGDKTQKEPTEEEIEERIRLAEVGFFKKMRQREAQDIVKRVKRFVATFLARPPPPEAHSATISEFLGQMILIIRTHPLWAKATDDELEGAAEGIEKYLLTKLYSVIFCPTRSTVQRDQDLRARLTHLQAVTAEHLELPPTFKRQPHLFIAIDMLKRMSFLKSPKDKVNSLLVACKYLFQAIERANDEMNKGSEVTGADDFLPALLFCILRANPQNLHSNIAMPRFIRDYRRKEKLVMEADYYLTQLESGVHFLENCTHEQLNLTQEEFDKMLSGERYKNGHTRSGSGGSSRSNQSFSELIDFSAPMYTAASTTTTPTKSESNAATAQQRSSTAPTTPRGGETEAPADPTISNLEIRGSKFSNISLDELVVSDIPKLLAEFQSVLEERNHFAMELASKSR